MADAVYRRFPDATLDAVTAAIETAGLAQSGLARFVNRLQVPGGADWPKAAMTGEVAYRLAVALHEAGILDRVPPCTHCGRPRMVKSRGSALPTCDACGPRNADGTKARSADPGKAICPAGLHRVPAHTLRCDACADEANTALIQDAILQVGASAELARTVIANVLLSRMSRRRVAEWLRAGRALDQDDAPPPSVQRLRYALAAELPNVSPARCTGCGSERRVLPIRVRTAASARTATAGRRAGSRPARPAGRTAVSSGVTMTAGPGAARAVAAILMSSNSASGAAELGKFRREQWTGQSVFAATRLPLSDAADACGTARCGPGPTTGRSASPVPATPWNAAPTAEENGSSPGCGPGATRGGASTASRGPPQSSQHLRRVQRRNRMSKVSGWRCA